MYCLSDYEVFLVNSLFFCFLFILFSLLSVSHQIHPVHQAGSKVFGMSVISTWTRPCCMLPVCHPWSPPLIGLPPNHEGHRQVATSEWHLPTVSPIPRTSLHNYTTLLVPPSLHYMLVEPSFFSSAQCDSYLEVDSILWHRKILN